MRMTFAANAIATGGQSPAAEATTVNNDFEANVGEVGSILATVTVFDQDGGILCDQVLTSTDTKIAPPNIFVSSFYAVPEQGSVDTAVDLTANPTVFAPGSPGVYQIAITGSGCQEYLPEPVKAQGTLTVASSAVSNYPGTLPAQPQYDVNASFFSFEFPDGRHGSISFGGITNGMSQIADYGFLQIVTGSVRAAVLEDNTEQYIANFQTNALDDHDGNVMSPVKTRVAPGSTINLVLRDSPGFQIVDNWNVNGVAQPIMMYGIQDFFTAYLMSRSEAEGSQWVAIAKVNWSVTGTLVRNPPGVRPKWAVNPNATIVGQPNAGSVPDFPFEPVWTGTAQGNVLATVVGNAYESIPAGAVAPRGSVRY
jgi:hypothetical protein